MLLIATTLLAASLVTEPDNIVQSPAAELARRELVTLAFPEGDVPFDVDQPAGDREIFYAVLETDLFLSAQVGPFDVFVRKADGLSASAEKTLTQVVAGLEPLVPLMEQFEGEPGGEGKLVGGKRFPIVVMRSAYTNGERSFDQVLGLFDWCDWTGWKAAPPNVIWSDDNRRELTVRDWEVELFNLHDKRAFNADSIKDPYAPFLSHGLGYYTIGHVTANLLRRGVKADIMPHWFQQGLIDELDIAAYGEAWVGGDWWEKRTAGWYNPGYSGFLPAGARPPATPSAPPEASRTTVTKAGDSWQHRSYSGQRHWDNLVVDRKTDGSANFRAMSGHNTLLPRDRAYSRCVFHILLELAPPEDHPGLLLVMDRAPITELDGMPDSEPLQLVLSEMLGGIPEIEDLSQLTMEELLEEVGQEDIVRRINDLDAAEMLRFADHRDQSKWLGSHDKGEMDWDTRLELWDYIQTAEWYEQEIAWQHIAGALDRGTHAVLKKVKKYPMKDRDLKKVREAFWDGIED